MADILFEKKAHIATVTFNRPEKKNSWTPNTFVMLADAWKEIQDDVNIRVAILTGAGDMFSAGGDLGSLIPLLTGGRAVETDEEQRFMDNIQDYTDRAVMKGESCCYKPVIGAVNGVALGGGFEILQCTDIRVAANDAKFGLPEVKRAIVPGAGSMVRLIRQLPHAKAMEILLTGEMFSADQLLEWGFLNYVVEPDQVMEKAHALAQTIADNGPIAVQAVKEAAVRTLTMEWSDAFAIEAQMAARAMRSSDAQEGPKAFKEKRKPVYQGK